MRPNVDDFNDQTGSAQKAKQLPQVSKSAQPQVKGQPAEPAKKKKKSGKAGAAIFIIALIVVFGVSYYYNLEIQKTKIIQFFLEPG